MSLNKTLQQAEDCQRHGRLDQAEKLYQEALAVAPNNADAQYGLGTAYIQREKYSEAIEPLKAATNLLPGVPEFHFNLALAEKHIGNIISAKHSLLNAAQAAQGNSYYLLPFCKQMLELGMAHEANKFLETAAPETTELTVWRARALGAAGNWGGALQKLSDLAEQSPEQAAVWYEHAKAAGFLRDYSTAIRSYKTYLQKGDATADDYLGLANLYLSARDLQHTEEALETAFSQDCSQPEAHFVAAKCARLKGNFNAMKESLNKALELRPNYGQAWHALCEIAKDSELPALAQQCSALAKATVEPTWDTVQLEFASGRAFEKSGEFTKAFDAFSDANEMHKALLAKKNALYNREATIAETNSIIEKYGSQISTPHIDITTEPTPVFILGMPRSGTTLVEKILTSIDGVIGGGENEALEFLSAQYYWDIAHNRAPVPSSLSEAEKAQLSKAYWDKTPVTGKFVTDKMPHNFRHIGLICLLFPQAPIIYMRRNPLDVCLSIYSRLFPDGHRYACDLEWLAHFYSESERLRRHWSKVFPERVLEIDYQELVESPEKITREIATFCKLEWHSGCLDFHKKQSSSFTYSELQVRRPINRDGINRWQKYEAQLQPLVTALQQFGVT